MYTPHQDTFSISFCFSDSLFSSLNFSNNKCKFFLISSLCILLINCKLILFVAKSQIENIVSQSVNYNSLVVSDLVFDLSQVSVFKLIFQLISKFFILISQGLLLSASHLFSWVDFCRLVCIIWACCTQIRFLVKDAFDAF